MRERKSWQVVSSTYAHSTFNPIRHIMENMTILPNPEKPMIALSIGDPTVFGNLKPAKEILQSAEDALHSGKYNGYGPSTGLECARAAVAKHWSVEGKAGTQTTGFPLYTTLAAGLHIDTKHYELKPESNWEVDLESLEAAIDDTTAAIVVNNPSNPCGSVYTKQHLERILDVASEK
ncbi:hypothetical protein Pmani_001256 [Petrolisthes manimaculis]|uniref:Aminotransferase class I/classII large domain-containing protein n=1 Tax=Petrolisthes manimaculis TaxID=1843537 RepID=A0AAE1QKE2_9EUCA|nr:hypothetical protein Pmani_001256 [Petrolisthes manimaculis]